MPNELEDAISAYQISDATARLVQETPIVLLVGISGAGKDTIKRRLVESGAYHLIVSHTTRQPRKNGGVMEQNGREYHFIDRQEAIAMLGRGDFVEAKAVHGNMYGTSAAELAKAAAASKVAIADIEVQGVAEYKAISDNVIALYILPPSFDEWLRRLYARYVDTQVDQADIHTRMHTAIVELEEALARPYYHFIINDDLDHTVATVDKIAHNHDEFNKTDDKVRAQAELLLQDLRAHVA